VIHILRDAAEQAACLEYHDRRDEHPFSREDPEHLAIEQDKDRLREDERGGDPALKRERVEVLEIFIQSSWWPTK
jgi:hypothetical protein